MNYTICFVSTATKEINKKELNVLFEEWKVKNNSNYIKGFLLYSDGNFFQYLEGEKSAILQLGEKIKKDTRHKNVIQVVGKEVKNGSFNYFQTENLNEKGEYKAEVIEVYLNSLKGIDSQTQRVLEAILGAFKETRIF